MQAKNRYVSGVCNIGKSEIEKRRLSGWMGIVLAVIVFALFLYTGSPRIWRLVLFFPATVSAIGFLQAYMHFCAYFGMSGVFNFGREVGRTNTVKQAKSRARDRLKALRIIVYSAVIGFIVAGAAFLF